MTSDDTVPVSLASTVEYFAAVGTAKAYAVITMTVPTTTATTVRLTLNPSDATPVLDESINQNPFETKTDEYEFVIPVWYTETTSADYGRGYGEIGFYVIGGCTLMISKLTGSILFNNKEMKMFVQQGNERVEISGFCITGEDVVVFYKDPEEGCIEGKSLFSVTEGGKL